MIIIPTNSSAKEPVVLKSQSHFTATGAVNVSAGDMVVAYSFINGSSTPTSAGWTNDLSYYDNWPGTQRSMCINHLVASSDGTVTIPSAFITDHTTVAVVSNFNKETPIGAKGTSSQGINYTNYPDYMWTTYLCQSPALTAVKTNGTSLFLFLTYFFTPSGSPTNFGTMDSIFTAQPTDTVNQGSNFNFRCFRATDAAGVATKRQVAYCSTSLGGIAEYMTLGFEIVGQ